MSAIYVLWLRELKRYLRSRVQIIGSLAQPAFYLLALGFGFNYVFEKAGQGSYMQFMAPGMIGMTVLLSAIFSGVTMLWDRQFGVLKAALVSPVPRLSIMLGRTLGGATVGVFQGVLILLLCMLAGFRPQHWFAVVSAFGFVAAISLFCRTRNHDRLRGQGHAELSGHRQLYGHAHGLSLWRALSAESSAQSPHHHHYP